MSAQCEPAVVTVSHCPAAARDRRSLNGLMRRAMTASASASHRPTAAPSPVNGPTHDHCVHIAVGTRRRRMGVTAQDRRTWRRQLGASCHLSVPLSAGASSTHTSSRRSDLIMFQEPRAATKVMVIGPAGTSVYKPAMAQTPRSTNRRDPDVTSMRHHRGRRYGSRRPDWHPSVAMPTTRRRPAP